MKILVTLPKGHTRDTFIPAPLVERINSMGDVSWNESSRNMTPSELANALQGVDVCLTGWGTARFSTNVLNKISGLRLIAHTGGTVAPLVGDAVYDHNIRVLSGNELYAQSVAEGVLCYTLTALRQIPKYTNIMKREGWTHATFYNEGLLGRKVGLVGFGTVSRYVAKLLKPFGCELLICSGHLTEAEAAEHGGRLASMEEVFSTCSVVSLHLAANEKNFHIIDERLLNMMPDGALLVNTARGSLIDERSLAAVMKKRPIKAVLDVYEHEPLPMSSALRTLDNVLLVPHMAGPTVDRRQVVTSTLLDEVEKVMNGGESWLEIDRATVAHMTQELPRLSF